MHDPVRIISKIKNNRLLNLWESSGLKLDDFCAKFGICKGTWYQMVSLKRYPSEMLANKIATALGVLAEDLWPPYLRKISTTVSKRTIPEPILLALSAAKDCFVLDDPNRNLFNEEKAEGLEKAMQRLAPREKMVLEMRFGLKDNAETTLEDTAKAFYVSKERIRQIEAKALKKLSRYAPGEILEKYIDFEIPNEGEGDPNATKSEG